MRKFLIAASAAVTLVAPVAQAGHGELIGGCGFSADAIPGTDTFVGTLEARAVTTDGGILPTPVSATVECELRVSGDQVAHLTATQVGTGVHVGVQPATFTMGPDEWAEVCTRVDSHAWECRGGTQLSLPPPDFYDQIRPVTTRMERLGCPVLASHAGDYGAFRIDGDGDVHAVQPVGWLWDCPPAGGR